MYFYIWKSSVPWFPWKIKRGYVEFIYSLIIVGYHETEAEVTKPHTSSCDKNRDKLS